MSTPANRSGSSGEVRGFGRLVARIAHSWAQRAHRREAGELPAQRARGTAERLLARTASGVVYVVLTVGCIVAGAEATAILVAAQSWLCCSELYHICRMSGRMPNEPLGLLVAVAYPICAYLFGPSGVVPVSLLMLVACACWFVLEPRAALADVAVTVFGPIYTSLSLSCIVLLRITDAGWFGMLLTFGVILSVWANDVVAYIAGSTCGKHLLAPRISPRKSFEGLLGGLVGAMLIWLAMTRIPGLGLGVAQALIYGLIVGLLAMIGDLFESRIKRGVGIKDSGSLMPGHGGLLDRCDSLLFGTMTAYLLLTLGGVL